MSDITDIAALVKDCIFDAEGGCTKAGSPEVAPTVSLAPPLLVTAAWFVPPGLPLALFTCSPTASG